MLTPDEFVIAGDNLVARCPTWSWSGGDSSKRVAYLPADKQFLITRNVPCVQRARMRNDITEAGVEGEDGWIATRELGNPEEEAVDLSDSAVSLGEVGPTGGLGGAGPVAGPADAVASQELDAGALIILN